MVKIIKYFILLVILLSNNSLSYGSETQNFSVWLNQFKKKAISQGISKSTVDAALKNAIFLPKVIEYDRFQPEFYEDTLLI